MASRLGVSTLDLRGHLCDRCGAAISAGVGPIPLASGAVALPETPVVLAYPFVGRWAVQMSPADRVPSHGTSLMGSSHAIDFVPVDGAGRSAPRTWRSWVASEPPEDFVGFGRPLLSPVTGRVVAAHDGEPDHEARRAPVALLGYALTQRRRLAQGAAGLAGNHLVVALGEPGPVVLLAHLRRGSLRVSVGEQVEVGQEVAACGSSGNSTEPHVHVQVSDSTRWDQATGVPLTFRRGEQVELPRSGTVVDVR